MKIFLFFFFWKAIKIAGSAQKNKQTKNRVGRVSGNTGIFLGLNRGYLIFSL